MVTENMEKNVPVMKNRSGHIKHLVDLDRLFPINVKFFDISANNTCDLTVCTLYG